METIFRLYSHRQYQAVLDAVQTHLNEHESSLPTLERVILSYYKIRSLLFLYRDQEALDYWLQRQLNYPICPVQ